MSLEQVLYTATATSTGGREGKSKSSDGVLDIQLTGMSGLELQQQLAAMGTKAYIIFITAHDAGCCE